MMKKVFVALFLFLVSNLTSFSIDTSYLKSKETKDYNIKNVLVATYSGVIIPVAAEYIGSAVDKLNSEDFDLMVLQLDTPGGLDASMREIIKKMLASKKPVVVYVYPDGARAASAGVFITMASNIAAMSPSTNIGAAHPVMLGGGIDLDPQKDKNKDKKESSTMEEKVLNDAKAYIRSICQHKNRNVDWAVNAVTKSDSITAKEALDRNVIEFVAKDLNDLLSQLNGFRLDNFGVFRSDKIDKIIYFDQTKRQKFLSTITDPNIAMLLMSVGAIGIFIELYNPGLILPGVVGAVSLVIGLYSFQTLTANFAGVLLILLGFVFFIAEIKFMSYGLLTFAGVASVVLGATMLFKGTPDVSGIGVDMGFLTTNLIGIIIIVFVLAYIVVKAHMRKVETGKEAMIGKKVMTKTKLSPNGKVIVDGEWWDAESLDGDIDEGSLVEIISIDGFKVNVKKVV
ncbi:MAG: nodulation protein NfeD [Elusimicrobia bacterium]|jgi:membrane-bound serine protease (ClpP class)|nr:nodulation protein NfeD [Elusimicrobiota bacterium]